MSIMLGEFSLDRKKFNLTCVFRTAIESDLPKLEWFGQFFEHRQIIGEAFGAQRRGEGLILVAAVDDFPVAQLWVRLPPSRLPRFWAFRVMQPLQGLGIGSHLLRLGEKVLISLRFASCEVGVEKSDVAVRRLYEKMGYRLTHGQIEGYSYVTPNGEVRTGKADQWILQKKLSLRQGEAEFTHPGQ